MSGVYKRNRGRQGRKRRETHLRAQSVLDADTSSVQNSTSRSITVIVDLSSDSDDDATEIQIIPRTSEGASDTDVPRRQAVVINPEPVMRLPANLNPSDFGAVTSCPSNTARITATKDQDSAEGDLDRGTPSETYNIVEDNSDLHPPVSSSTPQDSSLDTSELATGSNTMTEAGSRTVVRSEDIRSPIFVDKLIKLLEEVSKIKNSEETLVKDRIDWEDQDEEYFRRKEKEYYNCIERLRNELTKVDEYAFRADAANWHTAIKAKSDVLEYIDKLREKSLQIHQYLPFLIEHNDIRKWRSATKDAESDLEWGTLLKRDTGTMKLRIETLEKEIKRRNQKSRELTSQQKNIVEYQHKAVKRVQDYLLCSKQHLSDFEHNLHKTRAKSIKMPVPGFTIVSCSSGMIRLAAKDRVKVTNTSNPQFWGVVTSQGHTLTLPSFFIRLGSSNGRPPTTGSNGSGGTGGGTPPPPKRRRC
uniref:SH3 domain-containing protein n=1 Tax=Caenorhabditis tropicalis TaxID=1561998 RepID=A0A1I7V1T2_9PELO